MFWFAIMLLSLLGDVKDTSSEKEKRYDNAVDALWGCGCITAILLIISGFIFVGYLIGVYL